MNPTPDIDIGELRRLEKAANAPHDLKAVSMSVITNAEADYFAALRNAAPALLAKWEECERLREALIFARARIAEDSRTMNALAKIFAAQGADLDGKLADGIEIQRKADAGTFAIIDSALSTYEGKSE